MKETEIYRVNAFKDTISDFLFSKWQHFYVLLFVFFSLQVIISYFRGTLVKIEYIPFLSNYLIAISLFYLLRRFFIITPQVFRELFANKIFRERKGIARENVSITYNKSLQKFEIEMNARHIFVLAFLFCFLVVIIFVVQIETMENLDSILWNDFYFFPLNWLLTVLTASLMWFVVGIFMWKMYCVVSFLWKLAHQYEFHLNPTNRDGFGGFRPLGQLWINMALIIAPFSLSRSLNYIFHSYFGLSYYLWRRNIDYAVAVLIIIAIIIFLVYPMKEYHDIVRSEKLKFLKDNNVKVSELWTKIRDPLLSGTEGGSDENSWDELERSMIFFHLVRRIPSWPFTLSEKVGILLIVIVPWIIEKRLFESTSIHILSLSLSMLLLSILQIFPTLSHQN